MPSVRNFAPNWFTVSMGTGITALGAYLLPGSPSWLKTFGTALWLLNILLLLLFAVLLLARVLRARDFVTGILHHPQQSLFLGAIPMALTTVVNGFVLMGVHLFGPSALSAATLLWVLNALLALLSGVIVPYVMFVRHDHSLERMTGAWLMPIVPAEVAAASLCLLIPHLTSLTLARSLLFVAVTLWALSVPLAFLVLGVLFLRLALHRLPPREMNISTWISLGTLGTGVMGMMGLVPSLPRLLGPLGGAMAGAAALAALVLWGFGLWWLAQSILLTLHQARRGLPFNLGWWGLTFPLGVFTGGTDLLYAQFRVPWLAAAAVLFYLMLFSFWLLVATRTALSLRRAHPHLQPASVPEAS